MALKVEGVLKSGVHAEKTLCGASRLEPLHLALSSSPATRGAIAPAVAALKTALG